MDIPDSVSTAPTSPDSTVPGIPETSSSITSLETDRHEPKRITDIPSEIILQIYSHLHTASEIIALNSTSWKYYWIWRMNATSISDSVLPRSIMEYDTALELFELEEHLDRIDSIDISFFNVQKHVRVAQQEARHAVAVQQQGRRSNNNNINHRRENISQNALYRLVLHRNNRLLLSAHAASHILSLVARNVLHGGGGIPHNDFDITSIRPPSQDLVIAYHELTILIRLYWLEAMQERLQDMCRRRIQAMLYVATYLVLECPDKDKIRLGISRRVHPATSSSGGILNKRHVAFEPRCQLIHPAWRAFIAVAEAMDYDRVLERRVDRPSGCHGDCEESMNGE